MSATEFLKKLPAALNVAATSGVNCTIQFSIATPVFASIAVGTCTVSEGVAEAPDVTLIIDDQDLIALLKGELDGMTAFMGGKLQVEGDLMLAQQISGFFDAAKLI